MAGSRRPLPRGRRRSSPALRGRTSVRAFRPWGGRAQSNARQAARGPDVVTAHHGFELALVAFEIGAIDLGVPQMQHAGGEASVLAADTGVEQAHHEVGILL